VGRALAPDRVAHGGDHVDGLLVTEAPWPRGAGRLAEHPGRRRVVVAPPRRVGQGPEDAGQGGSADAPDRLGGQAQLACLPGEPALLGQLALQRLERLQVVHGGPAEGTLQRLRVDVLQGGARVVLGQAVGQALQVGQLLEGAGGVAHAQRLALAVAPALTDALVPVQVRPAPAQRLAEPVQLVGQAKVLHGLLHEASQLLALLGRQRGQQPAGRCRPPGQGVDQLVEVGRVVGEHVAVVAHEALEGLLGVLAAGVGVQHRVEVGQHVLDPLHGGRVVRLQALLHAPELGVEDLAAEQVADLLVGGGRLGRAPAVVGQLAHGAGGVVRELVQLGLGQPGGVRRVGEQGAPLLLQGPVEQLADLDQGAVHARGAAQLAAALAGPAQQVVQATQARHAAPEQVGQRLGGPVAAQDPLGQAVEGAADVERRRQRVGPAPPGPVPVTHR
jgi:hypothetical protein